MRKWDLTPETVARLIGATHVELVHLAMTGRPIHPKFAVKLAQKAGASVAQRNEIITPEALARMKAGKRITNDDMRWEKTTPRLCQGGKRRVKKLRME